jgi:hypothetical protein
MKMRRLIEATAAAILAFLDARKEREAQRAQREMKRRMDAFRAAFRYDVNCH